VKKILPYVLGVVAMGCHQGGSLFDNPSPKQTGIDFSNEVKESDDLNILDYLYFYNGGGVAIGDINNDGLPDIYFSGNQVKNKLYLNKGNMVFEDITEKAGVSGASDWNTGTVMADVNGDGLLDIYVCAVVGINGFGGYNELFINNGDLTFTEKAQQYGLDFESYSSSASFFDYDLDGDLDLYVLNHAIHTSASYGKADLRYQRNYETGDKLLRNDNGRFVDVSERAGIYGGINGYGLGLAVSDFNLDGYPDIYVGNDFHEDDYYYLNNGPSTDTGEVTFTESLREYFGHTSRFSMGNDVADINHDGLPDMISLDMLPENEIPLKASEGDDNIQVQKMRIQDFGYHYQFTRNMVYVNQPDGKYMETALLSGVAGTDWSWSALFGDYDQDGNQDLFVANGIPKRPNDLDFIKFISSDKIQNKINNTKLVDQKALEMIPSGVTQNYIFQGDGHLTFLDKSRSWIKNDTLVSGASAYGDLDNDGDLDLVVNNLNAVAHIYENKTNGSGNYLKVKLEHKGENKFGIGSKVYLYYNNGLQFKELFPARGFQASSEPILHFGLGGEEKIDSLQVIWPDATYQTLTHITANKTLNIVPENNRRNFIPNKDKRQTPLFQKDTTQLGILYAHSEDNYLDFNREKLIPYRISDRGPAYAKGDINNDGKEDLFFGGSKFNPPSVFVQGHDGFQAMELPMALKDSITENVSAHIADFNGDNFNDVLIGNGGGDFFGHSKPLADHLLISSASDCINADFPEFFQNTSVIKPFDYDDDGDLDVFLGGHTKTAHFGEKVPSYLLLNENGTFRIDPDFKFTGMVTDALWDDFDQDGTKDLIIIGEWMAPHFFKNNGASLVEKAKINETGLWQSIHPFDIDKDGDMDYLLGNWGLNSKFKASLQYPLRLYFSDFDNDGQTETITAFEKEGTYYTLEGLDALAAQMVSFRKTFNSYTSFAGKSIEEIFALEKLEKAQLLEVNTLASGYLKNEEGTFKFVPFPQVLQVSPIMDFISWDFDGDKQPEVLAGGNYFGVKPYHGRFDSFPGALIKSENEIILGSQLGLDFTQKSIRHLDVLTQNEMNYLLAIFNNSEMDVYKINSNTIQK